jgi:competence ComEA-like helix-hairpin-helix protein
MREYCRGFDLMIRPALTSIALILAVFSPVIPAMGAPTVFPDGPAKDYVSRICLQCHEPAQLLNQKRTESDWKTTVARMALKGVAAPAEQYDAIAAYMAKNFGKEEDTTKINMNKAKAEEIVTAIGLTSAEATALVAYREKHGEYREWGEMLVVYGVDGRKLEAAKDRMSF